MNHEYKKGMSRITNRPVKDYGYVTGVIDDKHMRLKDNSKWHMKHKPYSADYDKNLIKRKGEQNYGKKESN